MVEGKVSRTPRSYWFAVLAAAIPSAAVPFISCALGYGAYLRVLSPFLIPLLIACSWILFQSIRATQRFLDRRHMGGRCESTQLRQGQIVGILSIFLLVWALGWGAGYYARKGYCESICRKAQPLLNALEEHRREHGAYPSNLQDLEGFDALVHREKIVVIQGKVLRLGLDIGNVEDADLTLYLEPLSYLCVVPMEKKLFMSFSRFYILRKDNLSSTWSEDHLVWTFSSSAKRGG
jgi:hypothetical protein